ncbi:UrcA family protein [Sphingomonas sp. RB56-2]|uniref:UrcA family protein n=1 Tax=Sphingomonas brevis TaxID=2908206 RepID=A0ABT0SA77_9SPHN|nr:UrcA family protein [Sphingomonas brevis]MCL6741237.1 UrcA family protein [Sphingomonas brevis]
MSVHLIRVTAAMMAASLAIPIAPAIAQDHEVVVRGLPQGSQMRMVSYRDLNLNIIAHRKILDERVERAVRQVCDFQGKDNLAKDYHMCADRAWGGARPQITRAYVQASRLAYGR